MIVAMLNGFETILILMVVAVIFMASLGFQFDLIPRAGKKAFFYFLMTLGALAVGCLLALMVSKVWGN